LTKATDEFAKVAHSLKLGYASGFGSTMLGGGNGMGNAVSGLVAGAAAAGGSSLFSGIGKFLKRNLKNIVKYGEVAALEAQAAVAEVGTAGTLGTVDEIATQALVAKILSAGGKREKGGPVGGKIPYIVGEKGPELFVPKTSGTIIPNHIIGRAGGGSVDAGGFASMLLNSLGAPLTSQNISNLTMWEGMEGGNWHNTAKYNPLNTSYQMGGSVNYNTGKAGGGVQAYGSWADGLNATVNTLTGSQADARGYSNIVRLLRSGSATKADFLKALQGSAWDAGHYKGGASTSVSDSSAGGMYSSSSSSPMAGFGGAAPGTVLGGTMGTTTGGGSTVNVYVTVPAATDPKHIAATTKAVTDAVSKATGVKVDRTK
jgi:hypothetical protein